MFEKISIEISSLKKLLNKFPFKTKLSSDKIMHKKNNVEKILEQKKN